MSAPQAGRLFFGGRRLLSPGDQVRFVGCQLGPTATVCVVRMSAGGVVYLCSWRTDGQYHCDEFAEFEVEPFVPVES